MALSEHNLHISRLQQIQQFDISFSRILSPWFVMYIDLLKEKHEQFGTDKRSVSVFNVSNFIIKLRELFHAIMVPKIRLKHNIMRIHRYLFREFWRGGRWLYTTVLGSLCVLSIRPELVQGYILCAKID